MGIAKRRRDRRLRKTSVRLLWPMEANENWLRTSEGFVAHKLTLSLGICGGNDALACGEEDPKGKEGAQDHLAGRVGENRL